MALLPKYQRLGIQARQPRSIDFADARESARLGSTISESVGRMSNFLFKKTIEKETLLGQERARNEGGALTLEKLEAQGGAKTISEKAAYELGARLAIAEIETDAQVQINNVLAAGELNNTPASVINQALADINDGFSESLNVFDPVAGSVLQQKITGRTDLAINKYNIWQSAKYAKELQEKNIIKMGDAQQNIINDSILPGMNPESIKNTIEKEKQVLLELQISEIDVNKWAADTYKTAVQNNTLFTFSQMTLSEQRDIIESSATKPLPGHTLVETDIFMNKLRTDYNNNISLQKGSLTNLKKDIVEQRKILENGGTPSAATILLLQNEADQNPFGNMVSQDLKSLNFLINLADGLKKQNPETAQIQINKLQQGILGYGEKGIKDTTFEIEAYKFAKTIFEQIKTKAKKADQKEIDSLMMSLDSISEKLEIAGTILKETGTLKQTDFPSYKDIKEFTDLISIYDYKEINEKSAEILKDLDKLNYIFEVQTKMAGMNEDQMVGYVMSLNKSIDERSEPYDYENVTTALEGLIFAKKLQENKIKELNDDPMAYAIKSGVISVKPIDFKNLSESVSQRVKEATQVKEWGNLDEIIYLTNDEKDMLSEALSKGSMNEQLTILATISEQGYDVSLGIFSEIAPNAPVLANIGALLTVGQKQSALLALKGIELNKPDNPYKPIGLTNSNTRQPIFNVFKSSMGLMQTQGNAEINTANLIYSALANEAETIEFDIDLYEKALQLALGANLDNKTGGIQTVRDNSTLLPPNVTVKEVEDTLHEKITIQSIANASPTNQIITESMAKQLLGKRIQTDEWNIQAIGGGEYMFIWNQLDSTPQFAADINGEPLVINLLKLMGK